VVARTCSMHVPWVLCMRTVASISATGIPHKCLIDQAGPDVHGQSLAALPSQSAVSKTGLIQLVLCLDESTLKLELGLMSLNSGSMPLEQHRPPPPQSILSPRGSSCLVVELSLASYLDPIANKQDLWRGGLSDSVISSLRSTDDDGNAASNCISEGLSGCNPEWLVLG
nr:hypothetical protein [Tanacetum cinerariifolium]